MLSLRGSIAEGVTWERATWYRRVQSEAVQSGPPWASSSQGISSVTSPTSALQEIVERFLSLEDSSIQKANLLGSDAICV